MKRTTKFKKSLFALAFMSLTMALLLAGCGDYQIIDNNENYKTLMVKKGIVKFSFEYSGSFESVRSQIDENGTSVGILKVPDPDSPAYAAIWINVQSLNGKTAEASQSAYQRSMDNLLKEFSQWPTYEVLYRNPVFILGESGEEAAISCVVQRPPLGSFRLSFPGAPPEIKLFKRYLTFTHDKLLWTVDMGTPEDWATEDNACFDHIIQTLRNIP